MQAIKIDHKVFKLQRFSKSFAQCWWKRPILEGSLNQKTYLNHELCSKLYFLSSLAYKLVNLLIFEEKNHVK